LWGDLPPRRMRKPHRKIRRLRLLRKPRQVL